MKKDDGIDYHKRLGHVWAVAAADRVLAPSTWEMRDGGWGYVDATWRNSSTGEVGNKQAYDYVGSFSRQRTDNN